MIFATPNLGSSERRVLDLIRDQWRRLKWMLQDKPGRWSGLLRQLTMARGIRGSNSIEGLTVSDDDAAAAVEGDQPFDASPDEAAWRAVVGYREAMTHAIRQGADPEASIDESLIRGLHFMMMQHDLAKHPGQWRPGAVYVFDDRTSQTVYEGPERKLVPSLIAELLTRISVGAAKDESPLILAAMAHLNLTMIHPFSDGNGRMARCVQTLVLAKAGVFDPVFCSVEEWLGAKDNTEQYYKVLAAVGNGTWSPKRDAAAWIRFMLRAHYQQAATAERRQREISGVWAAVEEEIKKVGLPERSVPPLTEAAFGRAIRNSRYRYHADVNQQTASRDLASLVAHGLLVTYGERRGRHYKASDRLRALRDSHRQPKEVDDPFTL